LNATVKAALAAGEPAVSVDTKKKELVGDFKNGGRELRPKGQPEPVRVHDFKIPELGKVAPYGVYDIAANHGWVSVGVESLERRPETLRSMRTQCGHFSPNFSPQLPKLLISLVEPRGVEPLTS
jgi:Rhodopirellula transposase DDE domain